MHESSWKTGEQMNPGGVGRFFIRQPQDLLKTQIAVTINHVNSNLILYAPSADTET